MDYLGNKYKDGTKEAMTSMQGMGMYISKRWQQLWAKPRLQPLTLVSVCLNP